MKLPLCSAFLSFLFVEATSHRASPAQNLAPSPGTSEFPFVAPAWLELALRTEPAVYGMYQGGRQVGPDLIKEVDEDAWKEMPECRFYKDRPGTCYPSDPVMSCRFCKTSTKRTGFGNCPTAASFPDEFQMAYEWRLKPYTRNRNLGRQYACVVMPNNQFKYGGGSGLPQALPAGARQCDTWTPILIAAGAAILGLAT